MTHSTTQADQPLIQETVIALTKPLRLTDFIEAHIDDLCVEQGKLAIRPGAAASLILTLRSLFSPDTPLRAGNIKASPLIPGYEYYVQGSPSHSVPDDHIMLISPNENNAHVCISLLTFLNAFCYCAIPSIKD